MKSSVSRYRSKVKRLLKKLLKTKCEIKIEGSLDKLLATLEQQEAKEIESALITLPICAKWLKKAVARWSRKRVTPPTGVASFTLNLASLLAKNEERFCSLNNNNLFIKLVNVLKARQSGVTPLVKLAYVKLLSSFLEHKSGIEWMIACTFWENVFQFSLTDQDERVTKESTMFMSKLLETTVACDENFCDEVIKRIMSPLGENTYRSIKASTDLGDVSDEVASKHLKPALKLIGDILQHFLEGVLFDREDYRVVFSFLKNFHVEQRISDFMIIAQSKCLVYDIGKIMFIMQFLELYLQIVTKSGAADTLKASVSRIRNNFVLNLFKGTAEDFIGTCNFGQFYWKLTDTKIPTSQVRKMNEPFLFSCQCLLLMLVPQFCLSLRYFSKPISELEEELSNDVFREAFFQKMLKMVTQDVFRICYTWRDHFADRSDLFDLCKYVTTLAKESRKYYSRDEAVLLFQIQVYSLKDIMTTIKESPQKLELFLNETDYFCGIFEVVTILINEFDITWRDSFETIDVMALAFDFLSVPNWSTQVVVQALEVINVATAKYMTPNLALLVDSTADSTTALLGPLLYVKLLDETVEVKKAALEVIRTMAKMSNSKQKISIRDATRILNEHPLYVHYLNDIKTLIHLFSLFEIGKMESRVSHFKSKIIRVLGNLLAGKCEVRIDECLNKFLEVLEQQESKEIESAFVALEICAQWLEKAVRMWSATELTPATGVISFTMNLASLLSKNEGKFLRLHSNNFFIELLVLLKAGQIGGVASSVKLAYVKMLSSFLEHKSGIHWIVVCSFWENIFQFSLTTQDGDVTKESTLFMSKLLEKTIDYDEHFCDDVVKRIMLPLDANFYRSIKPSTDLEDADDEVATQRLMPTLKLIGDILHYFLDGILFDKKDYRVAFIFLNNFHLEERISDLMVIAQSKCLVFDVTRIVFMMQFLGLYFQVVTKNVYATSFNASLSKIRKNFIATLSVENFDHFDRSSKFGHFYWKLIHTKIPNFHREMNESLLYSTQCLVFMLLPQFSVTLKYSKSLGQIKKELSHDVFREDFIHKLMTIIMREAVRILFNLREYLLAHPNLFQIAKRVAPFAKESRRYYTTEQAVIVFQIQLYCLKDLTSAVRESPEKMEIFLNEMDYVQQVLENVTVLISEFDISWKDSFESIDVMAFAVDFLSVPDWSPQIVVQTLKLINVATAQCMTPNLALLVDSTADSATTFLGPLLYAKLLDDGVEVKQAALEVICTMGRMSKSKFPSLQKVLMDSELPTLVVKMSTCDGESFVRATAIKCLQEMIQVEEIWNNALKSEDLSQKMRDILFNETEGIVRVEAATFMCVAYENQQFPKDALEGVYETMIYSSTTDLHWEVKVRALGFWDQVIKNHLQNQGMIDGSFPNVTFSKEHRKIVTLTDSEIRKRLLKVLGQLSSIGCLGVLMSAIKDDCDMEVSKTAVKITQRLVELFKNYNVRSDCSTPTSPLPTENGMSATASVSSGISADDTMVDSPVSSHPDLNEEIIEQIVNSKDVCLLKNVYAPSDYGSVNNYDIQVRKIVTPNEFLQFTQQDLNSIIADKKNWLNGIEDLGSLLDDMLKTYDDDVNKMDCY